MRIEDVFDLNEENVGKFLQYVRATANDPKEDLYGAYCYLRDDQSIDPRTIVPVSRSRYEKQRDRIVSMLGQLKKIHDNNATHTPETHYLDLIDLQTKYDGTRWTTDPNFAIFLYILGNGGFYFGAFRKREDGVYRACLWEAPRVIEPMESPNDPNLTKRFPKR